MTTMVVDRGMIYADTLITYKNAVQGTASKCVMFRNKYIVAVVGDQSILTTAMLKISAAAKKTDERDGILNEEDEISINYLLEILEDVMDEDSILLLISVNGVYEFMRGEDERVRAYRPPLPAYYGSGGKYMKALVKFSLHGLDEDPITIKTSELSRMAEIVSTMDVKTNAIWDFIKLPKR